MQICHAARTTALELALTLFTLNALRKLNIFQLIKHVNVGSYCDTSCARIF